MKKIILGITVFTLVLTSCKKEKVEIAGCIDSTACNYDSLATVDDGSCLTIYGCMTPSAINYDSLANCPDPDTCIFSQIIPGCTDSLALNYNPLATIDDSSCIYPVNTKLTVNFTQTVDGVDLITNTLSYTNAAGENYGIQTLKYLISDITLHADDGSTLLLNEVHFIDISDALTYSFTYDTLTNNNYTSISFDMGLDSTKNSSNFYVNKDFHTTMFWPEMNGGGYHYMKLEGAYSNNTTFYNTHTGGTMGNDFSFNKNFYIPLNVDDNSGDASIDINMEINNWYQTPNEIAFSTYGMGIMMNMQKQMDLKHNGKTDVFSVSVSQ